MKSQQEKLVPKNDNIKYKMDIYQKTRQKKKISTHRLIPNIHVGVFPHSRSTKCVPGIMPNTLNTLVHSAC